MTEKRYTHEDRIAWDLYFVHALAPYLERLLRQPNLPPTLAREAEVRAVNAALSIADMAAMARGARFNPPVEPLPPEPVVEAGYDVLISGEGKMGTDPVKP